MIPEIRISDFNYDLPDDRIAKYPLEQRDASKLLEYKGGNLTEHTFRDIPSLIPGNAVMVFNDTRVVPARLHFQRETGAHIEIFCLEPVQPAEYNMIFATTESCRWKCIVGNVKRWKSDILGLYNPENSPEVSALDLKARLVERDGEVSVVEFSWQGGQPFSRVLEICGTVPIPPYLNRESEAVDSERYQTLYAKYRGSVAAPTAGLHFTESELGAIREKGVDMETVCLHVGAGTFLPVRTEQIEDHHMHTEHYSIDGETAEALNEAKAAGKRILAVGTTSVRTLESASRNGRLEKLTGDTDIFIHPGYSFTFVDDLLTNFHTPESTLLMLVSALAGREHILSAYEHAIKERYHFFSYGDAVFIRG